MQKIFGLIYLMILFSGINELKQNDRDLLEQLLHEFLEGASVNDYDMHNRFWADELIYTSASGERMGKSDIMNSLPAEADDSESLPVYSAENIRINLYRDVAVVAFELVAEIFFDTGESEIIRFYNTGTFLKRDGNWQAVAWQATQIP